MRSSWTTLALTLATALPFALWLAPAGAQDFPNKPIRMIVPVPPGGTGDMVSRLFANAAAKDLGQSIVVENRPGATGNIGTVAAVKSPADGYTIFLCSIGNCAVNASLYANPGYDLFKDVAPVALLGYSINVLTVGPQTGINTLPELLTKARAGQLSYASSGVGASNHLGGEMLKKVTGVPLLHVPYKGSGPAITDLLGGQVQVFFDNEPSILPFIKSNRVKPLAVTGKTRSANLPEVPTMEELGYKGFVIEPWYAIGAPAGTPPAIVDRLNTAFNRALQDATVRKTLQEAGISVGGGNAAAFAQHMRLEHDKWAELIRAQKITAE
ncbi:Bug family tripartite tricarboxylate transporter substrate binding protein [Hydrogenophaga sp. BPS33]|uniref:Bug family tripartite tricarboxylate transporter substrate binding protein n=1 Tax=Hydrogenophaga sp. BPS33 TaxID=2651974 RepID=UPI0013200AAD|nr:tripartite tricarboxylate transporter substrate binding protein [Hydrogenophaga sp. BPS33]QHE88402.1 tripartite tricarboxylate transporter substrate binding protein [Hydrogenophaga sp. BPS33]